MKCFSSFLLMLLVVVCSSRLQAQSTVVLHFNNMAGREALALNTVQYTNAAGEPFSVQLLQYFISNLQFTTADGRQYIVPQDSCYFFIQQHDSTSQYCTVRLPAGRYTAVHFMVGIDSLRCTSPIGNRKGVLDPAVTDMYWGWNSGYIFFKIEGSSAVLPEDAAGLHKFRYHIGGFGGYQFKTINNIKTVRLAFPQNEILHAANNGYSTIEIKADILQLFNGSTPLSIKAHPSIMFDAFSTEVAGNYAQMFSITAIKN